MAWQPIETAPKDGSLVFAWRKDWEAPSLVHWIRNSRTQTEFWNDAYEYDFYDYETKPPTHWLPIPPMPCELPADIVEIAGRTPID